MLFTHGLSLRGHCVTIEAELILLTPDFDRDERVKETGVKEKYLFQERD